MRKILLLCITCGLMAATCIGCISAESLDASQCNGLPDPAKQDCLRRKGEHVPPRY